MGQPKDLKLARLPPRLDTFTDIQAPSVKKERVNGKDKYKLTPARPGVITIFSDGENERPCSPRPQAVKRERSRVPLRAIEQDRQSSQPRIKQEPSGDQSGPQRLHGQTRHAAVASDTRRARVDEQLRRRQSQQRSHPPSDSSSSSDSSGSDSSDSSESEDGSDSCSDSSSSEDSSSDDDASASVYQPTTPASSIGSSPLRTRGKETGVQRASVNLVGASPSRRSLQNAPSIGSGHAPLDFFIDLPANSLRGASALPGPSRSHISATVEPTGAQAERTAHSTHHRPSNSSPVVLGFMPINRASPPPRNAPTEPRAMRIAETHPASAPVDSTRKHSESVSKSVPGPSSLPLRGPRFAKDTSQQKGEQRRGPARSGRIMQSVEQPPVESISISNPPANELSRRGSRVVTPGPSTRRTAPPPASPGIFVTPRAVSVRIAPSVGTHGPSQSALRGQGKRTFDEAAGADSGSKAAEWERMLARIQNHEKEMEQQRALLEDTKRLLAEQKSRIDDLEQRRRQPEEFVRDSAPQAVEEPAVDSPLPNVAHQDSPPAPVPCRQSERREERQRQDTCQSERRDKRKRRRSSRVARVRLLERERERIEQERQEDLELEQQLEQEQRRQAERIQCAARSLQNNTRQAQALSRPAQRMLDAIQIRIQHDVFNRPLSGLNPRVEFDDRDRHHISEATAFLMRLPQAFILARLCRLIEGKDFFETTHLGSTHLGCWVVSRRAACDLRMKLTDSGETHSFSFSRLAVRLWHDEQSLYSLLQHQSQKLKAGHTCHVDACMRPDHIVIETDRVAGERRKCKARGRCYGHKTVHKDGTRQVRKPCIFFPRGVFVR
ncbi:hypothetical protein KVR01_012423 [Diaporthe batatas]|uniref:uncharacterized protein n=1 Tax=Diaporthe batatas TaxID=748121 RepID=UPI001D05B9ED|nr:uncharacterized protein KVR01_012423 [Diaporthe batatas]KAG8157761.1 hypothetical protein KVR01_012423 [Diaporthe batatas]